MDGDRRKEIYDVCVKYGECWTIPSEHTYFATKLIMGKDVVICEDDPYSALQYSPYSTTSNFSLGQEDFDEKKFLKSLAPSFLRFDYQGRVIRLDSFSKVNPTPKFYPQFTDLIL